MEGQTVSPDDRPVVEKNHCSVVPCERLAAAEVDARPLCLDHFISVSLTELESRSDRLKGQPYDAAATDSFKKLLAACGQQAKRLAEEEGIADAPTRTRLLDILLRASDLSLRLRRSPRVAASVPVWLRREDPGRTWEEETWTSTLSRHGAGMECHHRVELGVMLVLCRKDNGSRTSARVVYSRFDSEGRRQIGLELLDRDDFWDLSPRPRVPEPVSSVASGRIPRRGPVNFS